LQQQLVEKQLIKDLFTDVIKLIAFLSNGIFLRCPLKCLRFSMYAIKLSFFYINIINVENILFLIRTNLYLFLSIAILHFISFHSFFPIIISITFLPDCPLNEKNETTSQSNEGIDMAERMEKRMKERMACNAFIQSNHYSWILLLINSIQVK